MNLYVFVTQYVQILPTCEIRNVKNKGQKSPGIKAVTSYYSANCKQSIFLYLTRL